MLQLQEALDGVPSVPLEGRDEHGNTMLHVACRCANAFCYFYYILNLYLCMLPPLPSLAHHVTPCSNGHMRIVKLLLRAGAAVNSENAKGQVSSGLGSNGS